MKKQLAVTMAALMAATAVAGCGSNSSTATTAAATTAAAMTAAETAAAAETKAAETEAPASAEKEHLEFWCFLTNDAVQVAYDEVIKEFNASQDKWEVEYVPVNSKDFDTKLTLAIAADTAPAILTLNTNMMPYVIQDLIKPIGDEFYTWDVSKEISENAMELTKSLGGGTIYGIPFTYNQDMNWYNSQFTREKGIEAPVTQKEFLEDCEKFADPTNNKYFFSLRGDHPGDNLFNWLFTYADQGSSWFDEDGKCLVNRPEFVEALDAYAGIYKNGWVSGDCVTNDFNKMVAEFGSGTAQYVMHNNGSAATHKANLGEGNYAGVKPLTNDDGKYYCSAVGQCHKYCLFNRGDDADYEGGLAFIEYMLQKDNVKKIAMANGSVPLNVACYDDPEIAGNEVYTMCRDMLLDENYISIQTPYWLPEFSSYRNGDLTGDFQSVLLGETSSQEFLDNLAAMIDEAQAEYDAK